MYLSHPTLRENSHSSTVIIQWSPYLHFNPNPVFHHTHSGKITITYGVAANFYNIIKANLRSTIGFDTHFNVAFRPLPVNSGPLPSSSVTPKKWNVILNTSSSSSSWSWAPSPSPLQMPRLLLSIKAFNLLPFAICNFAFTGRWLLSYHYRTATASKVDLRGIPPTKTTT